MSANLRNILSFNEREKIKRDIQSEKRRLAGETEGIPNRLQRFIDPAVREDPRRVLANIKKLERSLSNGSPGSLSKYERNRKEKMVREDGEWLKRNMVPQSHINLGWRDIKEHRTTQKEYDKAVTGCLVEHSPEFLKRAQRFKNNMRELAPDDPNVSSVESIRPESR